MAGRARLGLIAGVLLLAACNTNVVPSMPAFATSVNAAFHGSNMVFTVTPWPLDNTVAFLCQAKPGSEFTPSDPKPAAAAGCVKLETSTSDNVLSATFSAESLDPAVVGGLATSGPPWYLAVAGSRAPFAGATVLTVVDSPIFSPPGPS
jgi:hypothetical protein